MTVCALSYGSVASSACKSINETYAMQLLLHVAVHAQCLNIINSFKIFTLSLESLSHHVPLHMVLHMSGSSSDSAMRKVYTMKRMNFTQLTHDNYYQNT